MNQVPDLVNKIRGRIRCIMATAFERISRELKGFQRISKDFKGGEGMREVKGGERISKEVKGGEERWDGGVMSFSISLSYFCILIPTMRSESFRI